MPRKPTEKKMFTQQEVNAVLELWETKTTEQIAKELGRDKSSIQYLATQIRKAGYNLPRKRHTGTIQLMIKEVLKARKLIR